MDQDKTFLDLNLRLLVAQYGKVRVSEALSAIDIGDVAPTEIWNGIVTFEERSKTRTVRRRAKKSIEEIIRDAKPDNTEAESIIEGLARAYENREFLSELRDVRRFLDSRSTSPTKLRSRADALPMVVGMLARCELDELRSLDRKRQTRRSDLGIITDQILGRVGS